MKVLVTGGTGFIGRHVMAALAEQGHDAMSSGRSGADVRLDLRDGDAVREVLSSLRPEAVVHLAWQGLPDYSEDQCRANLEMGKGLIDAVAECGVQRVIASGSCWEHASRQGMLDETSETSAAMPFARAKLELLRHGVEAARRTGMNFTWLRLFFVYGPGQREGALIPTLLRDLGAGRPVNLRTPHARNDFIHVRDVADAVSGVLRAEHPAQVYNLGSGHATPLSEVVRTVTGVLGMDVPDGYQVDGPAEGDDFCADISRIAKDIGWSARVSLKQGIADAWNALQEKNA